MEFPKYSAKRDIWRGGREGHNRAISQALARNESAPHSSERSPQFNISQLLDCSLLEDTMSRFKLICGGGIRHAGVSAKALFAAFNIGLSSARIVCDHGSPRRQNELGNEPHTRGPTTLYLLGVIEYGHHSHQLNASQ